MELRETLAKVMDEFSRRVKVGPEGDVLCWSYGWRSATRRLVSDGEEAFRVKVSRSTDRADPAFTRVVTDCTLFTASGKRVRQRTEGRILEGANDPQEGTGKPTVSYRLGNSGMSEHDVVYAVVHFLADVENFPNDGHHRLLSLADRARLGLVRFFQGQAFSLRRGRGGPG